MRNKKFLHSGLLILLSLFSAPISAKNSPSSPKADKDSNFQAAIRELSKNLGLEEEDNIYERFLSTFRTQLNKLHSSSTQLKSPSSSSIPIPSTGGVTNACLCSNSQGFMLVFSTGPTSASEIYTAFFPDNQEEGDWTVSTSPLATSNMISAPLPLAVAGTETGFMTIWYSNDGSTTSIKGSFTSSLSDNWGTPFTVISSASNLLAVAVSGIEDRFFVAWIDRPTLSIFSSYSDNQGLNWSTPTAIPGATSDEDSTSFSLTAGNEGVLALYGSAHVLFSSFLSNGNTPTWAAAPTNILVTSLLLSSIPAAFNEKSMYVTINTSANQTTNTTFLESAVSTNQGGSWKAGAPFGKSSFPNFPAVGGAASTNFGFAASFLPVSNGVLSTSLYVILSGNGLSWTSPTLINSEAAGLVCLSSIGNQLCFVWQGLDGNLYSQFIYASLPLSENGEGFFKQISAPRVRGGFY